MGILPEDKKTRQAALLAAQKAFIEMEVRNAARAIMAKYQGRLGPDGFEALITSLGREALAQRKARAPKPAEEQRGDFSDELMGGGPSE